ncbi:hypothetical protein LTR86_000139 [Recurvomyces mirabilis]|nr:hypothetical protein LTR86_000139 [Recurvomyces mirabilis]
MAFYQDMPWHEGEEQMQRAMKVPSLDNPTVPTLSPQLSNHLKIAPTIAIGTLDKEGRPWTTLWGGEKGMSQSLGGGIIGIKTAVTGKYDPVVEELVGKEATGEVVREEGKGRMVGGLTIDLATRKRVKLFGRMIAGALSEREDEITGHNDSVAEVQLVLKIEQSLGNCPKYLNSRRITPTFAHPELVYDAPEFNPQAIDLIEKADLFFMTTVRPDQDMDTNHRGGPAGFLRVLADGTSGKPAAVVWPEYSGNRFYQSLGNMAVHPYCGICVPDFETGDMLYFTGKTEILVGKDAGSLLPKSNLCVKLTIASARFVAAALPFRGVLSSHSPYNPQVRYLSNEKAPAYAQGQTSRQHATLLSQTKLTPTISRFRFGLQNAATYTAGQYVTLDFSDHLDIGYSHMRDDDPRSINDDFVRTFTVSSAPGIPPRPARRLKDDEFEITVRNVGVVTDWLFKHAPTEGGDRSRAGDLEIGVKGFGGDFEVKQEDGETVCYIAAGVGITPLLPSLGGSLDYERLRLLWTVRASDLNMATEILETAPELAKALTMFVTGATGSGEEQTIAKLRTAGAKVELRRLLEDDVVKAVDVKKYYLCTSVPMRKQLMEWLPSKELIFEDFNF